MAKKKAKPFSRPALKKWLYRKYRGRCHYCTIKLAFEGSTIDHKRAQSKGGTYEKRNLVLACQSCNGEKSDMPYTIYKKIWAVRLKHAELRLIDTEAARKAKDVELDGFMAQFEKSRKEVANWPKWMRREARWAAANFPLSPGAR
jgi:hypothetical protein